MSARDYTTLPRSSLGAGVAQDAEVVGFLVAQRAGEGGVLVHAVAAHQLALAVGGVHDRAVGGVVGPGAVHLALEKAPLELDRAVHPALHDLPVGDAVDALELRLALSLAAEERPPPDLPPGAV